MNNLNKKRVIFYIDGFSLYHGMREAFDRKYLWLDIEKLAENLCKPNEEIIQINYFTAIIQGNPNKQKRQETYLDALETLHKVAIYRGKYSIEKIECRLCQQTFDRWREKMTDVNISVRMIADAFEDNFDIAKLISGDKDLQSPVKEITEKFIEKKVFVYFPPGRFRQPIDLKNVCADWRVIKEEWFILSQFPDEILIDNNQILKRPYTWH
jgi:uncharacterized LabA/DUF88 family protein